MECDQPLEITLSYQDGTDLDANLLTFDQGQLTLAVFSMDYEGYADNLQHDLVMTVKHEFESNPIKVPFTIMLSLNCERIPYQSDFMIQDVTLQEGSDSNLKTRWNFKPTECGRWTFVEQFGLPSDLINRFADNGVVFKVPTEEHVGTHKVLAKFQVDGTEAQIEMVAFTVTVLEKVEDADDDQTSDEDQSEQDSDGSADDEEDDGESGFEIEIQVPQLDPLKVNCENETVYDLPKIFNATGQVRTLEVSFDNQSAEFAFFDAANLKIYIRASLLNSTHEGNYSATVTLIFGKGAFVRKIERILKIEVSCFSENQDTSDTFPDQDTIPDTRSDEDDEPDSRSEVSDFVVEKRTPMGVIIPEEKIYDLSEYEVKENTDLGEWIPDQPIPRLKSVTQNGLVSIGWDRKMIIPVDLSRIPSTRYVVYDGEKRVRL